MELLDILFWLPFPPKLDIIYACSPLQNTKYIDIYIRLGTIHLGRRQIPPVGVFFTTIHQQIW